MTIDNMDLPVGPSAQGGRPTPLVHPSAIRLFSNAAKSFGSGRLARPVFEDLSVEIAPGSSVALLGPNACGKSTALNILMGLERLDRGFTELRLSRASLGGCVLQDYRLQLLPWASVERNILIASQRAPSDAPDLVRRVSSILGEIGYRINLSDRVGTLSGGQQQALVIARALAMEADVYLWDEPTTAIDLTKRRCLHDIVNQYWRRIGATVIMCTHDVDEAICLCDRILVFDAGMTPLADLPCDRRPFIDVQRILDSPQAEKIRSQIRQGIYGAGLP
jgi:ABC-type nitrate/sulfonate/bicarbonate transport system ATPase subunit